MDKTLANGLRTRFANALAEMYSQEVALYPVLVEETEKSNAAFIATRKAALGGENFQALEQEVGDLNRINGERHGAIRLGSAKELVSVAELFAVMDMQPVGFYNLGAAGGAAPVISTAFRPLELHQDSNSEDVTSPFRMFCSVFDSSALDWNGLPEDKKQALSQEEVQATQRRMEAIVNDRGIFPTDGTSDDRVRELSKSKLGDLIVKAHANDMTETEQEEFIQLAVKTFEMSDSLAVSSDEYQAMRNLHEVAADIVAFPNPHLNHLTPRALDISDVYRRMCERGQEQNFTMLDRIQGPPTEMEPTVLLNQTSYIAKPTWMYADSAQQKRAEDSNLLVNINDALQQRGVYLGEGSHRSLQTFGMSLDTAGYDLARLFPDEEKVAFSIVEVVEKLEQEVEGFHYNGDVLDVAIVAHTARFGEIEQRGIALTPEGRQAYDHCLSEAQKEFNVALKDREGESLGKIQRNDSFQEIMTKSFSQGSLSFSRNEDKSQENADIFQHLIDKHYAFFTYELATDADIPAEAIQQTVENVEKIVDKMLGSKSELYIPAIIQPLVDAGVVKRKPLIYEDFLPKSAAGIFKGNQRLQTHEEYVGNVSEVDDPKFKVFEDVGVSPFDPYKLYAAEEALSVQKVMDALIEKGTMPNNHAIKKVQNLLAKRIDARETRMASVSEGVC